MSYMVAGEDLIFFHVSSKFSSPVTSSARFTKEIRRALLDLRQIFDQAQAAREGGATEKKTNGGCRNGKKER